MQNLPYVSTQHCPENKCSLRLVEIVGLVVIFYQSFEKAVRKVALANHKTRILALWQAWCTETFLQNIDMLSVQK